MKILINGLQLSAKNSGVQYYTQNLHVELRSHQSNNKKFFLLTSSSKDCFSTNFPFLKKSRIYRIIYENFILPSYIRRSGYNLYHSPNYILPIRNKTPSVVTIHDLITFDYPKLCQTESVLYFRLFIPHSIKKAAKIITVSETVKRDIINRFQVAENKIAVIHLGVNSIFKKTINPQILNKYQIPEKYIFFVGNIEPKKNLVRLIKAYYSLLIAEGLKHKLVIAGKKAWKYQSVFETVKSLGLENQVIFTGYIPIEDLPALYSMADLFVFPSLYEGFGIPPLEAMACETPVLVSNKGALPETTGGNCVMVDPYNIDDIAKGMYQLLTTKKLRSESVKKGIEWVKQFTWKITAQKTIDVYREVLENKNVEENKHPKQIKKT